MDFNTDNFDSSLFGSGLAGLFGGLFGHSDKPYEQAMNQYNQWGNQSQAVQQPYLNAGTGAIGDFKNWLNTQKDPGAFINSLMSQYQESPYATYLKQQSQRAGQNAASASGLTGSTPLLEQLQQNANNISSQDLNQWLQHVLGINTQYGAGQQGLLQSGQSSANSLTNMYADLGKSLAEASYGKEAGKNSDRSNIIGGIGSLIGSIIPSFL